MKKALSNLRGESWNYNLDSIPLPHVQKMMQLEKLAAQIISSHRTYASASRNAEKLDQLIDHWTLVCRDVADTPSKLTQTPALLGRGWLPIVPLASMFLTGDWDRRIIDAKKQFEANGDVEPWIHFLYLDFLLPLEIAATALHELAQELNKTETIPKASKLRTRSKQVPTRTLESIPTLNKYNGKWVQATSREMQNTFKWKPGSLRTFRSGSMKSKDGMLGIDKNGFVWRRDPEAEKDIWYLKESLRKNTRTG